VVVDSERRTHFETEGVLVIVVQGHPRSLILVPVEMSIITVIKISLGHIFPVSENNVEVFLL